MSDTMLLDSLRLPLVLWRIPHDSGKFLAQQQACCVEAADRIEADAERIKLLEGALRYIDNCTLDMYRNAHMLPWQDVELNCRMITERIKEVGISRQEP